MSRKEGGNLGNPPANKAKIKWKTRAKQPGPRSFEVSISETLKSFLCGKPCDTSSAWPLVLNNACDSGPFGSTSKHLSIWSRSSLLGFPLLAYFQLYSPYRPTFCTSPGWLKSKATTVAVCLRPFISKTNFDMSVKTCTFFSRSPFAAAVPSANDLFFRPTWYWAFNSSHLRRLSSASKPVHSLWISSSLPSTSAPAWPVPWTRPSCRCIASLSAVVCCIAACCSDECQVSISLRSGSPGYSAAGISVSPSGCFFKSSKEKLWSSWSYLAAWGRDGGAVS